MKEIERKIKLLELEHYFILKLVKYLKKEITLQEIGDETIRNFPDAVKRIHKYNEDVLFVNKLIYGDERIVDSPIYKHYMIGFIYDRLNPSLKSMYDVYVLEK